MIGQHIVTFSKALKTCFRGSQVVSELIKLLFDGVCSPRGMGENFKLWCFYCFMPLGSSCVNWMAT